MYGASSRGKQVLLHFVQFMTKQGELEAHGLPKTGQTWYPEAVFAQISYETDSEASAKQYCSALREYAAPECFDIHVIANPNSGKGKGEALVNMIRTQAKLSRHKIHIQTTKAAGQATTIAKNLLLSSENSIVATVGGDGTMCEALEGLLKRDDADTRKLTICYIPAGSANAVANLTGQGDPSTAIWALFKGKARPIDLFEFNQGPRTRYGALSVTSGMVSDIDIDSEIFRCCGPPRFTAYAVIKIFCCCGICRPCCGGHTNISYPMKIHYVPADKPTQSKWDHTDQSQGWETWEGSVQFFHLVNAPALDTNFKPSPDCRIDDGMMWMTWSDPLGRIPLVGEFDRIDDGVHLKNKYWRQKKVQAVYVEIKRKNVKVVLDGEVCEPGKAFSAHALRKRVNCVVGSGTLPAFGPEPTES